MAKTKDNLKSLKDIFREDVRFEIPEYQRGYSWGVVQLNDLWGDIENINEARRTHYTGMFTFCEDEGKDCVYYLVDGQQRMTTLIILINEILNKIDGGIQGGLSKDEYIKKYLYSCPYGSITINYKFQYSTDSQSDAFFKTKILCQKEPEALEQLQNTLYTRNLMNAKNYFAKKIQDYTQDQLATLFIKVTEQLKFNEYIIDDMNVYITFETMNNRGKSLSTLELLKNRLLFLSTLFSSLYKDDKTLENVKTLRTHINIAWKTIYRYLGKSENRLDDDTFLKDHWIMYFGYSRSASAMFKDDLLQKTFTAKNVLEKKLEIKKIDDYVKNLQQCIEFWFNINRPQEAKDLNDDFCSWLSRLNRVGLGSFKPLLLVSFLKNNDQTLDLIKVCERFRFLVYFISSRRSNTADSYFYTLAHKAFYSEDKINLINEVEEKTNYWTNIKTFVNECAERYEKREGFYSWNGIRYFLYEYEKYLQNKDESKVEWKIIEKNQEGKVSIEHIYPQTPTDDYWKQRFNTEESQCLINSLGNLLLLRQSKNSSLQNESFKAKKQTTYNTEGKLIHSGYDNGSYSELEVARIEDWTPVEIKKRGEKMLKFMQKHWKINIDDKDFNIILNIK